jgi:integral membrane sensor domain MASE1
LIALPTALLLAASVFAAYVLNHALGFPAGSSAWAFWIPNGVALAFLVRRSRREWPLLLLAYLIAKQAASLALSHGAWGAPEYQGAFADLFEIVLAAVLVLAAIGRRLDIPGVRDIVLFVALVVIAAPLVPAILSAEGWSRAGGGEFWTLVRDFYVGDLLGMLIATPALLAWWRPRDDLGPLGGRPAEAVALGAVTIAVGAFIFLQPAEARAVRPLPYAVVPLLLWGAARFGL